MRAAFGANGSRQPLSERRRFGANADVFNPRGVAIRCPSRLVTGQPTGQNMARTNLFKFMQEVRSETQKVTWPSRRETAITTAMVFVMVALASVFFLVADQVIRILVTYLLGIGS
jgi:preprotein translocase subunit SecE